MNRPLLGALGLLFIGGCSSTDSRIYEPGEAPRLRDGTIVQRTRWAPGDERRVDVRRIKARDGRVTCELVSHDRGHWQGQVPEQEWVALWTRLFASKPFERERLSVEPDDPNGGPYHHIRLELGKEGSEFSAQLRQNLLIFSSRDVSERLEYSGAIVDLVAKHATEPITSATPATAPEGR